jgi:hypothetical protein
MEDGEYTWLIMEYQQLRHFHYLFLLAILSLLLLLLSIKKKPLPNYDHLKSTLKVFLFMRSNTLHIKREGNMHIGK